MAELKGASSVCYGYWINWCFLSFSCWKKTDFIGIMRVTEPRWKVWGKDGK